MHQIKTMSGAPFCGLCFSHCLDKSTLLDVLAGVLPVDHFQAVAEGRELPEQHPLLYLELVGVAAVGVEGVRVDPLGADLEQFPRQVAHLGPLAEEGAVRVGRRRNARAVDLDETREERNL